MKSIADILILALVAAIGIAAIVCLVRQGILTPSEGIEVGTLGTLILVTAWYAYSTHRIQGAARDQAEISKRATEIALNTARNAVLPIVSLGGPGTSGTTTDNGAVQVNSVSVSYSNIGEGPALNLKVWLSYPFELDGVGSKSSAKPRSVLGVGEDGQFLWQSSDGEQLPSSTDEYDIVAEYTDIYRRPFRSTLFRTRGAYGRFETEFSFIQVPEVE